MTLSYIGVTQGADAKILVDSISNTGYPVSKMILGDAGDDDGLVSKNNPVPMTLVQSDGGALFDAFEVCRLVCEAALRQHFFEVGLCFNLPAAGFLPAFYYLPLLRWRPICARRLWRWGRW